jgi:hypothetical protein
MHLVESKCLTVKSEHDAQAMYGMAPIGTLEDFLIHGLPAALQSGKLTSVCIVHCVASLTHLVSSHSRRELSSRSELMLFAVRWQSRRQWTLSTVDLVSAGTR